MGPLHQKDVFTLGVTAITANLDMDRAKKVSTPQMVEKLKDFRVVKIASYNEHTAALIEPYDDSGHFCSSFGTNSLPVTSTYIQQMKDMVNDSQFSDVTFVVEIDKYMRIKLF